MTINKNLLNCLCKQRVKGSIKFLWILIDAEEKDQDGFFKLCLQEWTEKLDISTSQLKRDIKELYEKHLIEKTHRTNNTGGKKIYVKSCQPETFDKTTFLARFDGIEEQKTQAQREVLRTARFSNIQNINNTISFKYTWVNLYPPDDNSESVKTFKEGDYVYFKATVVNSISSQKKHLNHIRKIRPRYEYYDN